MVHQTPTCWGKPQFPASNGRCHNLPYEKIGKNDPACIADEVPFEIPESWEWVRLGSVCQLIDGKKLQNKTYNNLDARYMRGKAEAKVLEAGKFVTKGTYLILVDGENSGEVFIAPEDGYMGSTFKILWVSAQLYARYVLKFIELYREPLRNSKKGAAIPHLNKEILFNLLLPVPSLQEQTRIVDKIVELTPSVERYDLLSRRSDELNRNFPNFLKKSILQYAVQGKLVSQDPTDEPASVLLEHIRAEKEQLIKSGKIKRDKHESVIFRRDNSYYERVDGIERCIDDEIPFEISESWEWSRLYTFGTFSSGKTPTMSNPDFWNGEIPWVTSKDMKHPIIADSEMHITDEAAASMKIYPSGTLVLVARSGILKRLLPLCKLGTESTINQDIKAFSLYDILESQWLYYVIKAFEPYILKELVKSVTTVESLKFEEFQNLLIPVPPKCEQDKIVVTLDDLMKMLQKQSSDPLFLL